jgi:hypothetical protein
MYHLVKFYAFKYHDLLFAICIRVNENAADASDSLILKCNPLPETKRNDKSQCVNEPLNNFHKRLSVEQ